MEFVEEELTGDMGRIVALCVQTTRFIQNVPREVTCGMGESLRMNVKRLFGL